MVLEDEDYKCIKDFLETLADIKDGLVGLEGAIDDFDPDNFELRAKNSKQIIIKMKDYYRWYDTAEKTVPQRDPLIIDLGEEGIELTDVENGVYFDLDNNGFAEKTAWIGTEDGFLALDVNGNGVIDNGGELFGDKFVMPDGNISRTGSEALASLDENSDGFINAYDTVFENLCIWIDADHDISPDSRGGNIDARDLHVIESFMGREFEGVDGSNPMSLASISNIILSYLNIALMLLNRLTILIHALVQMTAIRYKQMSFQVICQKIAIAFP